MHYLMEKSYLNHDYSGYLLSQICLKKFFIALWLSAGVSIIASYFLARKSVSPIRKFTQELASVSLSALNKRLNDQDNPKELRELALACNELLLRIDLGVKRMKQFSASMAHELRNPIHFLQTATEISLTKTQTVEDYQQLLHHHLEEYQVLTQLIDNLLFLARSEEGHLLLNKKKLAAKDLISQVIDYYRSLAEEKKTTISIQGDGDIEVDEHLFKRVIANLIDNSLTYTPEGGHILCSIEPSVGNSIRLSIKDNGIGIAKEHLNKVFQGFYRVDYTSNNETKGLGLGLAIAKSIVEHHHGELSIESTEGIGTTVYLNLKSHEALLRRFNCRI